MIAAMGTPSFVLASASPRRRRLITWLDIPFEAVATDIDEDLGCSLRMVPPVLARSLAADKARAARRMRPDAATIVAFDTFVVLDRRVLGKPADLDEARRMLGELSGRGHDVVTGVAVLLREDAEPATFAVTTPVSMRELDRDTVDAWLSGDEALGCAGAYNIEHHLASVGPDECYENVAGLPVCHVHERLARLGIETAAPVAACTEACGRPCPLGERVCARAR